MATDNGSNEIPVQAPGLHEELVSAFSSARDALMNFLDLVALEARHAGLAITSMLICGLVAAVCMAAAWLGLMAALAMLAVSLGVSPLFAVMAIAMINGAAAVALMYGCIAISRDLLFSATRRQLAGQAPDKAIKT